MKGLLCLTQFTRYNERVALPHSVYAIPRKGCSASLGLRDTMKSLLCPTQFTVSPLLSVYGAFMAGSKSFPEEHSSLEKSVPFRLKGIFVHGTWGIFKEMRCFIINSGLPFNSYVFSRFPKPSYLLSWSELLKFLNQPRYAMTHVNLTNNRTAIQRLSVGYPLQDDLKLL